MRAFTPCASQQHALRQQCGLRCVRPRIHPLRQQAGADRHGWRHHSALWAAALRSPSWRCTPATRPDASADRLRRASASCWNQRRNRGGADTSDCGMDTGSHPDRLPRSWWALPDPDPGQQLRGVDPVLCKSPVVSCRSERDLLCADPWLPASSCAVHHSSVLPALLVR